MKKLDVSVISDSAQFKLKSGTLQFLQDANSEVFTAMMKGLIGGTYDPTKIYVLYGCINTGVGVNYNISEGAVFYNGEVFLVDAAVFTVTIAAVFSIVTTQYTTFADPCTLTDTSVVNIHNIRKMKIDNGVSSSFNYDAKIVLNLVVPQQISLTGEGVTGSYPNYMIPGANGLNRVLTAGSVNIGNIPDGGLNANIVHPAPLSTDQYYVVGTVLSLGNSSNDAKMQWVLTSRSTTGFSIHFNESTTYSQNITFEFIIFAK